jgi:hypothetical protein
MLAFFDDQEQPNALRAEFASFVLRSTEPQGLTNLWLAMKSPLQPALAQFSASLAR